MYKSRLVPRASSHLLGLLVRPFCTQRPPALVATVKAEEKQEKKTFQEQTLNLAGGNKINVKFDDTTVCYELPEQVGGTTFDIHGQYMVMFTCNKCDTKQTKFFTKNAYHHGVVLVRCDGCHAVHLMADNLGWYGDEKVNIETIMKEKNSEVLLGHADPQLLEVLNKKVEETRKRFEDQQKVRQAKEAEQEAAEKKEQEEEEREIEAMNKH